MSRTVRAFLPTVGDPRALARAFGGDPQHWLPSPRRDGPDQWRIDVHASTFAQPVRLTVGMPWHANGTVWRAVSWDPLDRDEFAAPVERLLPVFDGELGLVYAGGRGCTLALDGRYAPPGGAIGAALDAVALRLVARKTVERLVADIAARLTARALLARNGSADGHLPHELGAAPVDT